MDQTNWKVGLGREKPCGRENKLHLSPNISFKPKEVGLKPILSLVGHNIWLVYFLKKKRNPSLGENLSIYFPSQWQSEIILCIYFSTLYLPMNKIEAGKRWFMWITWTTVSHCVELHWGCLLWNLATAQ